MKEKIYTIPISEVFEKDCFCAFCDLYKRLEEEAIIYTVGPAMMEPDFRAITNRLGFCKKHIRELNAQSKALAMALVLDTHLLQIKNIVDFNLSKEKKKLFTKNNELQVFDQFLNEIEKVNSSCTVCERIDNAFNDYIDTFVLMLKKEPDFLEKILKTDGFCIEHFGMIMRNAKGKLNDEIIMKLKELELNKINKYKNDIESFIDMFDYHNAGKKMSVPSDTVIKTSFLMNGEFEPKEKTLTNI